MKYCILIAVFLFCSCSDFNECNVCEIEISTNRKQEELLLSSFIKNYIVIPLETKDECLIAQIDKIKISNNEVYILDNMNNAIYVYGMDGIHHRTLFKVGNGPGEYLQLMDFDIRNNILFVLDFGGRRILKYDCELNYLGQIQYETYSTQISAYKDLIYLYNLKSKKGNDYKCSVFNEKGEKIIDKLIRPENENLFNYNESNVFSLNGDDLYISPVYDNYIYKGEDLQPVYHIRFKRKGFPDDINIEEQDVNSPDFQFIVKNNYYVSDHFLIFDYFVEGERAFCVFDKLNNKKEIGFVSNDLIPDFRFFPRWGDGRYLIEEINAGILYEYFPSLLKHSRLRNLSLEDNPVIILYEIKK